MLNAAILVCDTPIADIVETYGTYPTIFNNLLSSKFPSYDVTSFNYPSQQYDLYIITGSKHSVYDETQLWISRLIKFIQTTESKVLGICFGHQIIAQAFGGTVEKNPLGWEIGPTRVDLTDAGKSLFKLEYFNIQSMHQDTVIEAPEEFEILGYSEKCKVQVMAKGQQFLALQGHPEYTAHMIQMIVDYRIKNGIFTLEFARQLLKDIPVEQNIILAISLTGHVNPVESVSLDNSEELVVAGATNGTIKLWDLESSKVGHKSAIKSLEFHPFGEFFASGSMDLTVKIWDIRKKGCIQTYHGHHDSVSILKITPDGRWIATASPDSTIKIWDMTAGKLIYSIEAHSAPVKSISFHPSDFMMATSSEDGFIKIFDLNSFECLSTSRQLYPKACDFSLEGNYIYSATDSSFKAFKWEPKWAEVANVPVSWPNIHAIKTLPNDNKLIAVSKDQNIVGVWMMDTSETIESKVESISPDETRSFSGNFNQITLAEHPQEPIVSQSSNDFTIQDNNVDLNKPSPRKPLIIRPPFDTTPKKIVDSNTNSRKTSVPSYNTPKISKTNVKSKSSLVPLSDGNKPLNLDLSDFMKRSADVLYIPISPLEAGSLQDTEEDIVDNLLYRHEPLLNIFQTRLGNLKCVHDVWDEENIRPAIEVMIQTKDMSVWIDVLRIINIRPRVLNLDVAILLLPLLKDLLFANFEDYIITSCDTIKILCKSFSGLILQSINCSDFPGVDISRDERIQKCKVGHLRFLEIVTCLEEFSRLSGKIGIAVTEVLKELSVFSQHK